MVRAFICFSLAAVACKTGPVPNPETEGAAPTMESSPSPEPKRVAPKLRLPEGAWPISQAVDLRVVPGEETFTGSVTIEVELDRPLEVLWLNGTELRPSAASVGGAPAKAQVVGEQHLALVP